MHLPLPTIGPRRLAVCCSLILVLTFSGTAAYPQGEGRTDEGQAGNRYEALKQIETFGLIGVITRGSADKLGLRQDELTNLVMAGFQHHLRGIKYEPVSLSPSKEGERKRIGALWCKVWTVGETSPIAYHLRCQCGTFETQIVWAREVLGYGDEVIVQQKIKENLRDLIEELGKTFLAIRGKS